VTDFFDLSGSLGIVTGLAAEAALARRISNNVLCSGGRPDVAGQMAERLVGAGATSLMSFGICGGLKPGLTPGTLIVATEIVTDDTRYPAMAACAKAIRARTGIIYGGDAIVATPREKAELAARTGALAVDLESGPVSQVAARAGIPFIALRAVADPAEHGLPPAALLALNAEGQPRLWAVFLSVLIRPGQIRALMTTARETKLAMEALRRGRRRLAS